MINSRKNLSYILLLVSILLIGTNVFATKRYWVGAGANANWNNTANWSATSGGGGGSSVPGSSDSVYFDGAATTYKQCSVNATVSIKRLSITGDSLKQNSNTITVGTSGMILSGGVFLGGSTTITDNGVFTLSGCNFTSTSSSLTIVGNYTFSSGTFTHNNGEVIFTTTSTISNSTTFYNLTFSAATSTSTFTISSTMVLTCDHTLKTTGTGPLIINTGSIDANGDITINNNDPSSGGSALLTIKGTGSQVLTGAAAAIQGGLCNVTINKPSGTLTLKNFITISANRKWQYIAGTVDASSYTSTVVFIYGANTIKGTQSLYNVLLSSVNSSSCTVSVSLDTLTVLGELKIAGTAFVKIDSGLIYAKGDIIVTNTSTGLTSASGLIKICGTGDQTLTGCGVAGAGRLNAITVDKPSGTLTLSSIITSLGNWKYVRGTVSSGASTYVSYGGDSVSCQGTSSTMSFNHFTSFNNLTTTLSGTLYALGTFTIGASGILEQNGKNIYVGGDWVSTGTFSATSGGLVTLDGSSAQSISSETFQNLATNGSGVKTATGAITVQGGLTINSGSILDMSTFALSGSLTSISGSGTFKTQNITSTPTPASKTWSFDMEYNGTSAQTIPGGTYNNLIASGSSDKTAAAALTVNGTLTINNGRALSMSTFALSGSTITTSGTGTLKTQNTSSTPIPTGKTWAPAVQYNSSSAQTIVNGNYTDLDGTGGNRTLSSSGTVGISGTFTKGSGTYTVTGSTVDFNGAAQTIPAFTFNNLTTSGSGTKTASGALTVNAALTISSGTTLDMGTNALSGTTSISGTGTIKTQNTSSTPIPTGKTWTQTVEYNSSSAQTIVDGNYPSLNGTGGNRTLNSSGTIAISGTFTVGSGTYTNTGSTVDFNGTGDQTIPALNYNHLTVSGARTTNNVTLASSGTISIAGTFTSSATFSSGTFVNANSTIDFNGTGAQTISAFNYNNLTISGARTSNNVTLASSGTIGVAGTLSYTATFTSGSMVTTSSTVNLNGSQTQTIPAFTFNNLITSNSGKKSVSGNITVNGTLNLTSAELALAGNTLSMTSNAYNAITKTTGYISTTGNGKISRPTASTSAYEFPLASRTLNDSLDYFTFSLTPGRSSAQSFDGSLNTDITGFVITHDKALYGTVSSTVAVTVTSSSYDDLDLEYDINSSADISAVRVLDQSDNTWKTLPADFYTITGGNKLNILNLYQIELAHSKKNGLRDNMNWSYEISYDGNGIPVSEQIQYMDLLGRPTQQQVRNVVNNTVLASQTVYDNYGRAALQTLPAPIGSIMAYQNNFITHNNAAYTYSNFDVSAKLNSPDTVQNNLPGTLGWYYSDNNTLEAYQATTSYPYSRQEFTGAGRRAIAGDSTRMGKKHESKGYNMVSGTELKFIFGTNKSYKDTVTTADKLINNALTITGGIQASKNISVDADGKEVVTYDVGGLPIASCYTGITTGACTMTDVVSTMIYAGTSSVDIHLPAANKSSLKLYLPAYYCSGVYSGDVDVADITYKITDVATNTVLVLNTDYTINAGTRVVTFLGAYATGSSVFRLSFVYSESLIASLTAGGCNIPDATAIYNLDYSRWSVNYYDLAGRLRKSVSPKAINCGNPGIMTDSATTTYDYSSMGQLIASQSPDEGKKEMTYNSEGQIRFTQDVVQRAAHKFSYINYDAQGRMVGSGEDSTSDHGSSSVFFQNYYGNYWAIYADNPPSTNIINYLGNDGLRTDDLRDTTRIFYYPLTTDTIPATYTHRNNYQARYLMDKVCKTSNANSATWYGYNQAGQTVFTVQQLLDADYTGHNAGIDNQIKTVDYTYNAANGTLSDQTYQKYGTTEKLKHIFTYDAALRLIQVNDSIEGTTSDTLAKYSYYTTGALKRKELGNKLQGIDYIYTVNGQLKSINNPSLNESIDPGLDGYGGSTFGKDVFGLALDYHTGDYTRAESNIKTSTSNIFNGMISAQRYKTRDTTNSTPNGAYFLDYPTSSQRIISSTTDEIMNQYSYDAEYRLSSVVLGKFTSNNSAFTPNANNCFKEWGNSATGGINYDANGNITKLKRNAYNGSYGLGMDSLTYTYINNTNKLASILDSAHSSYMTDLDAATAKTFTYNGNGQMTVNQAEGITDITYYNTGLTKKVTFSSGNTAEYWYDDRGQKIKTKYLDVIPFPEVAKYTWYVNDAGGNILAIYEYDEAVVSPAFSLVEEPLYGSGRIGTLDKSTGVTDYEITDHLGNVRVTIKGTGAAGNYQVTSRTDYYAFGGAMPGRTYNLNTYRYNYQGQENAVNSNWQAFELRMHNSDLGRWMSPDPYGQCHSPYISMLNNPISMVDPDGGAGGWPPWLYMGNFKVFNLPPVGKIFGAWLGGAWGEVTSISFESSGSGDGHGSDSGMGTISTSSEGGGGNIGGIGGSNGPGGGGGSGIGSSTRGTGYDYYAASLGLYHNWAPQKEKTPTYTFKHPHYSNMKTGPVGNNKPKPRGEMRGGTPTNWPKTLTPFGTPTRTEGSTHWSSSFSFRINMAMIAIMPLTSVFGEGAFAEEFATTSSTEEVGLYHYTTESFASNISKAGLNLSKDGFVYSTTKGGLSPMQAQIELALSANRGLPNVVFKLDVIGLNKIGINPVLGPRTVIGGNFGAGGGTEVLFNQPIPAKYLIRFR